MISLTCGIYKIQQTGEQKKKQTHRHREQTSGYQWRGQHSSGEVGGSNQGV